MIEMIAEACHDGWMKQKRLDGYEYGPERCDDPPKKTHPLMKAYQALDEKDKEGNRITARLAQAKLHQVGLRVVKRKPDAQPTGSNLTIDQQDILMKIEHDIWMRDHLISGYEFAAVTRDALKLHRCVQPFATLTDEDKKLDKAIVDSLQEVLQKKGFELVAIPSV